MKKEIVKHMDHIKGIVNLSPVYKFSFNISELPAHNNFDLDIRKQPQFEKLFSELDTRQTYCLYWFECIDPKQAQSLIDCLNLNRKKLNNTRIGKWTVPPQNDNRNSNVIYVGVRQGGVRKRDNLSNLSGRIIQHLGYYKKGSTGALHLIQWAFGKEFDLTLNVMEIGVPDNKEYLYIIEKLAAIALKPLCGKH